MSKYYIDDKKIKISFKNKLFADGSEGNLYLIDEKLYKIYYPITLNDGFGNKEKHHKGLKDIKDEFSKIVLPESLIYDKKRNYCGYVTPLVGDKTKNNVGITECSWDSFIDNLKALEEEIITLSNHGYLAIDLNIYNTIFSKQDSSLYIVDPGRYHPKDSYTTNDYINDNKLILDNYFINMLEYETIHYKLVPQREVNNVVSLITEEKKNRKYSEYFEDVSKDKLSIHEFIKIKGKELNKNGGFYE